jgi:methylaspartate mutase epsilon subunit
MEVSNKRLSEDEFFEIRKSVLRMWPTGTEAENIDESVSFHRSLGGCKNVASALAEARRQGKLLIALRAGKPTVETQIEDLLYIENAGADLLPVTLDNYTRNLKFEENEASLKSGKTINGFPIVNHGVKGARRIMQAVHKPVTIKHGSIDARLAAEIGFAGGMSDINGNVYSWGLSYNKNVSILSIIKVQQYIARLMSVFAEKGVILANEQGGGQGPGCFRVPCISISNTILGALISAWQGVKAVQTAYGQGTNLVQDVASMRVLRKLSEEYMERSGFKDVQVTTIFHQWQGAFPENRDDAMGIICTGAVTAVLGGADQTVVKSVQEGVGIPTKEANAEGIRATREVRTILGAQRMPDSPELLEEMEIVEEESRAIIDAVLDIGDGDVALGTLKGIEVGIVEVPFTPSIYNYGKAIPVRDAQGAFRFLDPGNLPFSEKLRKYNLKKIDERVKAEGGRPAYEMVLDDIFCMMQDVHLNNSRSRGDAFKGTSKKAKHPDSIIMGVIGSDSHAIGNRIMHFAFKEAGFNVTNLGSFVSQEDFINAATETDAKAILVSSLCGHAEIDCKGLKEKLSEAGLDQALLYIGGNLAVGKSDENEIERKFKALGFNRVAKSNMLPADVIEWLNEDLEIFH